MIYGIWARFEWRGINLNYAGVADVMEKFALGIPLRGEDSQGVKPVKPMADRLAEYLRWLIVTRGRKVETGLMLVFREEAGKFIQEHKDLFAEIVLAGPGKNRETVDTGSKA